MVRCNCNKDYNTYLWCCQKMAAVTEQQLDWHHVMMLLAGPYPNPDLSYNYDLFGTNLLL